MSKEVKLATLKMREKRIKSRGKYLEAPGVLKKVQRQIRALEQSE